MRGPDDWIVRLSGRAGFQRAAFGLPVARRIARRRAGALFDLAAGFVHAQVLAACVALDLFGWTAERPRSAAEVAARSGLPPEAAERLLDAAVALDLLARRDGRYRPGPVGAPLAGPGGAGVRAMIAHHGALYRDLADPLAFLRGEGATALGAFWPYARAGAPDGLTSGEVGPYSALMSASQDFVARDVLDALGGRRGGSWPDGRWREGPWLDLGGGDGVFLLQAARRWRRLRGTVLDLPAVAALAQARFGREGVADRLEAQGGDFRRSAPAGGFAVVSLVRILHDHDDGDALSILRTARAALAPGGRLVVAEPLRGRRGDARITDAYFGLYLLAMGQGRLRTPQEIAALAFSAGFERLEERPTRRPFLTRLLVGA